MSGLDFDVHETVWIPMSDGTRLAARIWIPHSAAVTPVPAILEYIPYRRRDGSRDRDDQTYGFLAANGYAGVRLDIRGSGDSEGVLLDEYLPQEQQDAVEAIAWIAGQSWCSGAVGMMGISWGGFNALQVAARRPPALRAIVTLCSTDDRYADDMHYMGGSQLTGNLEWGSTFFAIMAKPPDPLVVGAGWRSLWMQRLEAITPMIATSLAHQRRDDYWKQGSVCEDIAAIECPVMTVGGWADGYTNPVFRLLRDLRTPRLGIVGPWGHKYPNLGTPGPAIGFLSELKRWWDHWLKEIDSGIMGEPMLRAYVQDWDDPASHHSVRSGRWVAEPAWPSANLAWSRWYLNAAGLRPEPVVGAPLPVSSPQTTGVAGGEWCAYSLGGVGPELALDQRQDDMYSLLFDGPALTEPLELLGAAMLELTVSSEQPVAQIIARLNDVAPDGRVARVSYGVLNLTHRTDHGRPEPLECGKTYNVGIALKDCGYRFAPGHCLRVALSTAYWPMVWPSPERGRLWVHPGSSRISLPARTRDAGPAVRFGPPEIEPPTRRRQLRTGNVSRTLMTDIASGFQEIDVLRDDGLSLIEDIGVETGFHKRLRYRIHPEDPHSARAEAHYELVLRHAEDWDVLIRTRSALACTATDYIVESDLEAYDGGRRVFSRSWTQHIARDLT